MYISLRVPGAHPTCWQAFECVDDTASDIMLINQCDVDLLVNMGSPFPALSSIIETTLADGTTALIPVILLEANIHKRTPVPTATGGDLLYPNGTTVYQNIAMTEWTEIQVAVNLPWPPVSRLNGPFVRQKLYTATNPTGEPLMHIFDRKGEFAREVPSVNGRRRAVPQLF